MKRSRALGARPKTTISITIHNVPDDAHARLKALAAERGISLQKYLHSQLEEMVRRPDVNAVIARSKQR